MTMARGGGPPVPGLEPGDHDGAPASVVGIQFQARRDKRSGEFLAQQAARLDEAEIRDELRPLARAAGLDM